MSRKAINDDDIPNDLKEIYENWGDGPSADDYYKAVQRYFERGWDGRRVDGTDDPLITDGEAKSS